MERTFSFCNTNSPSNKPIFFLENHIIFHASIGSIREAGGVMGKKGAAQEEMYFSKQNKEMKEKLKEHLKDEIKKHEEAIKASKELMQEIEKDK